MGWLLRHNVHKFDVMALELAMEQQRCECGLAVIRDRFERFEWSVEDRDIF